MPLEHMGLQGEKVNDKIENGEDWGKYYYYNFYD